MTAVQAMTGQGGWPMTVFMTADGEPFYGGTYFPPEDRGGLPAFPRVLDVISDAFTNRRMEVLSSGRKLAERIRQTFTARTDAEPLTDGVLRAAFGGLRSQFDDQSGGFGLQPKFPQPSALEFLLRYHARTGSPEALEMVELTLDRMAAGGIHDQIGGGFHRYSTDAYWIVPHFEKMLYDNALLARLYTRAYQVTGSLSYARVAQGIVDYVLREMTSDSGGFYSAQDADSEGVEGKFFVMEAGGAYPDSGTRRRSGDGRLLRCHKRGQLRGTDHPHRTERPCRCCWTPLDVRPGPGSAGRVIQMRSCSPPGPSAFPL